MIYNYIAIIFFALFSIAIPLLLMLVSKLIRYNAPNNAVKSAPYESGELSIGQNIDVYNEYMPYFMLFLPFEVVVVVLLLWAYVARLVSYDTSIYILALAIFAMLMAIAGYKIIGARND
ncbi:MAG: NADH-quinone oxidoreductase subunit A [Candidatus Micrarchaeia archaeon]